MPTSKAQQAEKEIPRPGAFKNLKVYLKSLGPGLIAGASDDDPSGIATYCQTGAQLGYAQLWTVLFTFPLIAAVQEICARIALQTGGGLAEAIRRHYPKPVLYFCVCLLFIANTINLGTDLGAMAASGEMLLGFPFHLWLVTMTLICAGLQVLEGTFIPTVQFNRDYLLNLVAILGTTISPYLFFWQAGQEIEEKVDEGKKTPAARRGVSRTELKWMRTDVISGMVFSSIGMWSIVATSASTLFPQGITTIDSAPRAAMALKPIAGNAAYVVFAAGIIGTGLLAVPILAGSAAYALAETFRFREGLYLKIRQAPGFYGVIALSTLLGLAINLTGMNPIRALYYTAVLNGMVAPPLLLMIMLISNDRQIMKSKVNGPVSRVLGWLTTTAMAIAAMALALS